MGGIMEAVKKGFSIASKSLGLVGILIAFNLVGNLVSMSMAVVPGAQATPQMTTGAMIFSVIFILVSIFFQGASLGLIRDYIKQGAMKLGGFAGYGAKYYLRLLGLGLIIIAFIAVVALIAGVIIAITAPLNNTIVTVIAVTIAIAIGVVAGVLYFVPLTLSPYALISDEAGVIVSMKKSLSIMKPLVKVVRLILLYVVLILISLGVGFAVGFLVGLIAAVLPQTVGRVLMAAATSVINGYLGIVMTAAFMVFYFEIEKGRA
ncbi:MAG: hypothetical protein NTZ95_00640 [Candidatus Omnitrophica bacterium]|nr:hypothetical protein [Candidatus Omnitrophota bacterium]